MRASTEHDDAPTRRRFLLAGAAVLFLQSLGAWVRWREAGSPIGTWLGPGSGRELDHAGWIAGVFLTVAIGLTAMVSRRSSSAATLVFAKAQAAAAFAVGGWMLLAIAVESILGLGFAPAVGPVAHAVRFLLPVALGAAALGASPLWLGGILRAAAGLVFIGHGLECWLGHPSFVDFLVVVPSRWLDIGPSTETARALLEVIGAVDVAVGAGLLLRFHRGLAAWMTAWGLLTAGVRLAYFGWEGWPEAAIRSGNGGAPLLLLVFSGWLSGRRPRGAAPP